MKLKHLTPLIAPALALTVAGVIASHMPPCQATDLPDSKCTPGATVPVDLATLCTPGYTATVRNVPESEKQQVLKEYGYSKNPGEIDHLISLELGGSNDIKNLWPEAGPIPNPKDAVENKLHAAVCSGHMRLEDAQKGIATDWRKLELINIEP